MTVNSVSFNQDHSYIAVGSSKGFRLYTTEPFSEHFETKEGDVALVEMLFSTSLVALVLSPRHLRINNTKVCPERGYRESVRCSLPGDLPCPGRRLPCSAQIA